MLIGVHYNLFPPHSSLMAKGCCAASEFHIPGRTLLVSAGISGSPSLVAFCEKDIPSRPADCKPDITTDASTASRFFHCSQRDKYLRRDRHSVTPASCRSFVTAQRYSFMFVKRIFRFGCCIDA